MKLHHNQESFDDLLQIISESKLIDKAIIEKDYFVTLFLKRLINKDYNFIFKGGTCLSKCYKVIERFSEDIDLSYEFEKFSRPVNKGIIETIKKVSQELDFTIENTDKILSGHNFNQYEIKYSSSTNSDIVKPIIIVETGFQVKAFPVAEKSVSSIIYDYLSENNINDIINKYDLSPFTIKTQSIERTFIDKVFAICDYFLEGKIAEHSRHIYDLKKLITTVDLNIVKDLIPEVRLARMRNPKCLSAPIENNINEFLKEIFKTDVYKNDFDLITSKILYEEYTYDECVLVIKEIIGLNIF